MTFLQKCQLNPCILQKWSPWPKLSLKKQIYIFYVTWPSAFPSQLALGKHVQLNKGP